MPDLENKSFSVGADGCKAGWFAICITEDRQWRAKVFPNIAKLWEIYQQASLILIDVPIGLRESGPDERICDKEARRLLGRPRASGVFPVPCRQAIYAMTYAEASATNAQITGRRLSRQTWGITPKISEVDFLLSHHETARAGVKEVHPEVCFWAFAGRPMQHNKRCPAGFTERLQVLQSKHPDTDAIVSHALHNYRRKDVAKDDILDALAAAVTAFAGLKNLVSISNPPEFDDRGLPMQMLYRPLNAG